ncbi:uncharacterized protein [Coffea arabica]|uniref:ABC transmembrane type-1 domain-containing protein n=1 Tax=Coffea arabica TaxID=13443 RepID=A0ABM4VPG2_COFAR
MRVSCWTITGERQASRLQGLYFETLLRQEIGYFDTEMTVGQALGMASSNAITIQDAMSEELTTRFPCLGIIDKGNQRESHASGELQLPCSVRECVREEITVQASSFTSSLESCGVILHLQPSVINITTITTAATTELRPTNPACVSKAERRKILQLLVV